MIVIFDLDDTLYPEFSFVSSGFAAVADDLSDIVGVSAVRLRELFTSELAISGRGAVFDNVYRRQGIFSEELVQKSIAIYRSHAPDLELPRVTIRVLEELSEFPLYLVTDGDPDVQLGKIKALGIESSFVKCLRTWSFGQEAAKPSLTCFEMILEGENATWRDLVYIGDDPSKDFVSLREVGARTIRVLTGRHATVVAEPGYEPEFSIASLAELPELIKTLANQR
jgi:putative hydrolase of the HAD superfamily